MAGATTRGYRAGRIMAIALIGMVHLMYQNNTAASFFRGLYKGIRKEMNRRGITS